MEELEREAQIKQEELERDYEKETDKVLHAELGTVLERLVAKNRAHEQENDELKEDLELVNQNQQYIMGRLTSVGTEITTSVEIRAGRRPGIISPAS